MKLKLNKVTVVTKALTVCCALAVTGLAGAGFAYLGLDEKLEMAQHDNEITAKMVDATRCSMLIRGLESAQEETVRLALVSEISNDLKEIQTMAPTSTAATKEFAGFVVSQLNSKLKASEARMASNQHITPESATLAVQKVN